MFLVASIEPWSKTHLNRLVKGPKIQFLDSGLLSVVRGSPGASDGHGRRTAFGSLLETFVYGEIRKHQTWAEGRYRILFYRDKDQAEVDYVLEREDGSLVGVEVKAGASVSRQDLTGLRRFRQVAGEAFRRGIVLYDGEAFLPLGEDLWAVPLPTLWTVSPPVEEG